MDIPSNRDSSNGGQDIPRIRNLHPSQLSPDQHQYYGATYHEDMGSMERTNTNTLSERIGSFVGSYSRTSLLFMAENLAIPSSAASLDDDDDFKSINSSGYFSRRASVDQERRSISRISRIDSLGANERASLLFSNLDKVLTSHSVATFADEYRFDAHGSSSGKKSSFTQSIFNSINILIGIGILALPLGFKCAGWVIGISVFVFCCGLTNYTAKLLAKCLDADPNSRTYGDMGAMAFGLKGCVMVTVLFITELITSSVALVVLLGDGIDSLFPGHDTLSIRMLSFLILTPMLFLPVRHLSYTSLLGIMSAFCIIIVIVVDGLSKPFAPGSLIEPADTELLPSDWMTVPLSFGLIMAGFAGHAVFPTVYRDMDDPKRYRSMVNWTYVATTIVYFAVAACGYMMFGSQTMQEITQNIVAVPEYNQTLNRLAVWLIAMNPIAKYGLTLNPVNLSWQILVFRSSPIEGWCARSSWREPFLTFVGKVIVSMFIVSLAYIIPGFDKIMALLGAFFSFMISGIFPLVCHLRLFGDSMSSSEKVLNYVLIVIASSMAFSGTLWSFI
ncbi:transmembrane amino acid transporter protein-domain-containing protein [Radiomyces spectabilis]|uniref:transmembrane amino acid transporter protein-domain-containing protein n=1 Tax=Radiomyces spectabilis TaxID=64574 RepID=UPI00221FF2BC|nr:transmembrane amino acid transporter protein-domain-containing protein [Radiomyces spectabilis]KAI8370468.1 transmembrane amino acid transporter protein-domain-containing protein [Radiomyces spectabilis]